jgi:hypothetical protein
MKVIEVYNVNGLPKLEDIDRYIIVICNREINAIKRIMEGLVISYNELCYQILIPKCYFEEEHKYIDFFDFLNFNYQKYCLFSKGSSLSEDKYYLFYDFCVNYKKLDLLNDNFKLISNNINYNKIDINYIINDTFEYNLLHLLIPIINIALKLHKINYETVDIEVISLGGNITLENKKKNFIKFSIKCKNNINNNYYFTFKIGFQFKNDNCKFRLIVDYENNNTETENKSIWNFANFIRNNQNQNINQNQINEEDYEEINENEFNYDDYTSIEIKCISDYNKLLKEKEKEKIYDNILNIDNNILIDINLNNIFDNQKIINELNFIEIFDNINDFKKQIEIYKKLNTIIETKKIFTTPHNNID